MRVTRALSSVPARQRTARLACVLVLAAGCAAPTPPVEAIRRTLHEMDSPAGPGSAMPQLAGSPDGQVLASWLETVGPEGHRFRFSRFGGNGWSEPVTIAEGDRFFANWADVPSLVALADGTLAAHWLERSGPDTYAYDVKVRLSRDGGVSWSDPVSPHSDGTQTEHGFVSMFDQPGGGLGLIWLDGRDFAGHGQGMEGMQAEMSLRATAFDGNTPRPETLLDDRVCECCPTTAVQVGRDIVVAYRDRSPEEVRNIAVARLVDGTWSAPFHVRDDNWQIPGCPVNGPALATDGAARVALVWFTAPGGEPHVYVAFSSDAGRSFGDAVVVDDGAPVGRVDAVMLPDGTALVSWIEQVGSGAEFRVRHAAATGRTGPSVAVAPVKATRASGYPRMVRTGDALTFAWTDAGEETTVRLARATLGRP